MPSVTFLWKAADGKQQQFETEALPTESLLQTAIASELPIEANCGGKGRCGKCKVVAKGETSPLDEVELRVLTARETENSVRLACRCFPQGKTVVEFVSETGLDILTSGSGSDIELLPDVVVKDIELAPPTLENPVSDVERIRNGVSGAGSLGLDLLRRIPATVREADAHRLIIYENEIIDIASITDGAYGIAVDIGTTTIALGLNSLETGEEIAVAAAMNGQSVLGADVISRIEKAKDPKLLRRLQDLVVGTINTLIQEVCAQSGVRPSEVYRVTIVGNTSMQHLFAGVDPTYLAQAPYVPVFTSPVTYKAVDFGLEVNRQAPVTLLPSIAGFVGADTVGVIMAASLPILEGAYFAIDIGTNGEMVLSKDGSMFSCSTAAGPAFEGGQILFGMRAAPGAIDAVVLQDEDVAFTTVKGRKAVGICGSGIIDLVAVLLDRGIIDPMGRMLAAEEMPGLEEPLKARLVSYKGGNAFVVAWGSESQNGEDIVLTDKDVRQVQLAKGAVQAGSRVLAQKAGVELEDLDGVFLAGAFGNYIRKESAARLGLIPSVPMERVKSLGNAARLGARLALLSRESLKQSVEIGTRVKYIELSALPEFQMEFMEAMLF